MTRPRWIQTKAEGVQRHPTEPGVFRIRVHVTDDIGRQREVDRILRNTTFRASVTARVKLAEEARRASPQMMLPGLERGPAGRPGRWRLAEYAEHWIKLKGPHTRRSTSNSYAGVLDNHVLPVLGDAWIDSITRLHVQSMVNGWMMERAGPGQAKTTETRAGGEGYTPATIRFFYRVFRVLMRDAVDYLNLERDPCRRIALPKPTDRRRQKRALTLAETRAVLGWYRAHAPHYFPLAAIMAITGLRWGHASVLRWDDIDEHQTLHVLRARDRGIARATPAPLAANKRVPEEIPLSEDLLAVLRAHRQRMEARRHPGLASGFMFPQEHGPLLLSESTWVTTWRRAMDALGIQMAPLVGPHALRRTFVDLLRPAGVHAQIARLLTAHATDEQFDDYASLGADEAREAFGRVSALVGLPSLQAAPVSAPAAPAAPARSAKRALPPKASKLNRP
jgi:integrase